MKRNLINNGLEINVVNQSHFNQSTRCKAAQFVSMKLKCTLIESTGYTKVCKT